MTETSSDNRNEKLLDDLRTGEYICVICTENIQHTNETWSCQICYNIFHLTCISQWAEKCVAMLSRDRTDSCDDVVWRCPSCQSERDRRLIPSKYRCFCGKVEHPKSSVEFPHCCENVCEAKLACGHSCNKNCHPGPHVQCNRQVKKSCYCGSKSVVTLCRLSVTGFSCEQPCAKRLSCRQHDCQRPCHKGACDPCHVVVSQRCHCGKTARQTLCYDGCSDGFICGDVCGRPLPCGRHQCQLKCHVPLNESAPCGQCELSPERVTHCPCGSYRVTDLCRARTSCADPIPTCKELCNKLLVCGPSDQRHRCRRRCHVGPCSVCDDDVTPIVCRCGKKIEMMACAKAADFISGKREFRCQKKCNRYKDCQKHRCQEVCCTKTVHHCDVLCNKTLRCGQGHKCERLCHLGACGECPHFAMEPLACYCGREMVLPPVPCGTKIPDCTQPCRRPRSCQHPVDHNCHLSAECPPCVVLTSKVCFGNHMVLYNVPCFQTAVSCGKPCGKQLPCVMHSCLRPCHAGQCIDSDGCTQPCQQPHPSGCGHTCAARCHSDRPCPDSDCAQDQKISCSCGVKVQVLRCSVAQKWLRDARFYEVEKKLQSGGASADTADIESRVTFQTLINCDDQCAVKQRNDGLRWALDVSDEAGRDPFAHMTQPVVYSAFIIDFARRDHDFVKKVAGSLKRLVESCHSSRNSATYRQQEFPNLDSDHRRLVHELSINYGCRTSTDRQDQRNTVIVYAFPTTSHVPSRMIYEVVRAPVRAKGQTGSARWRSGAGVPPPRMAAQGQPFPLSNRFDSLGVND